MDGEMHLHVDRPGVVARRGLTAAEFIDAQRLVDVCNRFEGLELALNLERADPGIQQNPNQFVQHEDGALIGCATLWGYGEIEVCLAVHPDRRRRGIGTALLAAAREECRSRGHQTLLLVFEEASPSGKAFVAAVGGRYRSAEYRMKLDLERLGTVELPKGPVQLESAGIEDAPVTARIIAGSFGDPEDRALRRVVEDMAKPSHRLFIARLNGEPIGRLGLVWHDPRVWIIGFGILPEHRNKGYGRAMLAATVRMLLAEDRRDIFLEVATDNLPALTLYRSFGFQETTTYGFYHLEA
jgi:ribosomal protein S18 acetylase RimI-like enzyme